MNVWGAYKCSSNVHKCIAFDLERSFCIARVGDRGSSATEVACERLKIATGGSGAGGRVAGG